jgi:oxazoline/thiazoline synthase
MKCHVSIPNRVQVVNQQKMNFHSTRFNHRFHCEVIPSEGVVLFSESEEIFLNGEAYVRVAPFLNGRHTIAEIVEFLLNEMSPLEALFFLDQLRLQGLVSDTHPSITPEQAAFWSMLEISPTKAIKRLQACSISVTSFGGIDIAPFEDMLESLGVRIDGQSDRWVVLVDDYLQEGLEAFNQNTISDNRPWMLVKPVGTEIWVGPIFTPGVTGCWECLRHRLQRHRQLEGYLQQKRKTTKPFPKSLAILPSTWQTAIGIAATETAKWIVDEPNKCLGGNIVTFNTLTLEKRSHILTRRPQCRCCGQPNLVSTGQSTPLALRSSNKFFGNEGGHRSLPPEETFNRLKHHISPITGISGDLQRISIRWENENGLTPTYVSKSNFSKIIDNQSLDSTHSTLNPLLSNLYGGSFCGKGKSDMQAKVSALGEAIERYAWEFQGDEARTRSKLKDLSNPIHPNACMLFSEMQFNNREQLNATGSQLTWVPEPFDEELEIEWSPVWSLTSNQPRYIPTAYCYYGYAQQYNIQFTRADSNGCAAGNTKEEAILQGFMELVERDSVALWWYNRLKKPAVDLSSFDDPYFQELTDYYKKKFKRDLWVLDITSDLNIPTFIAISRKNDQEAENILIQSGAHFDPKTAILSALTELSQSLYNAISFEQTTARIPKLSSNVDTLAWWQMATIENQPYLTPDKARVLKVQADYPRNWSDDLYTDVMNCVKIAEGKGLEILILDLTRPDVNLHVVKAIVPGLYHFWPRFAPGRLYNTPVEMGWATQPLREEQLNPQPIFY